jgi:hypothetical protein
VPPAACGSGSGVMGEPAASSGPGCEAWQQLAALLQDADLPKTLHDSASTAQLLHRTTGIVLQGVAADATLAAYVLDPGEPPAHSLPACLFATVAVAHLSLVLVAHPASRMYTHIARVCTTP